MSEFKSWNYVFIAKKHVINHGIVPEIKFKHTVESFRFTETFMSQKKSF